MTAHDPDAERFRFLVDLMSKARGGATLSFNESRSVYETPKPGEEVNLHWYPDTPVGFFSESAGDLRDLIDRLRDSYDSSRQN